MKRQVKLKITVAYDGRPFQGWQSQSGGNTVQDFIEQALKKICDSKITIHGAGRTDAGVHALGQCAHFVVPERKIDWIAAINANLPREIRILKCARATEKFHARFSATGKIYTYRIWNDPVHHPLEIGRSWHLPMALDLSSLRENAKLLTGTHDFAGFAANRGTPVKDTVRTIQRIDIQKKGPLLQLTFEGNGFLYKMVRLLTGSLIRCAQGRADSKFLQHLLQARGKEKTSFAAPAEGLYLKKVLYS